MIGYVWQKVQVGQLVNEISDLKKEVQVLVEQNEKEKAKLLRLSNDSRIIKIAQHKFDMTFPQYEVVKLPDDYNKKKKIVEGILHEDKN